MIVAVASGKGGTGKTTLATALAVSLDQDVTLMDCDVEEPNAALMLHPEWSATDPVYTPVPKYEGAKCTQCGKCAEVCAYNALALVGKTVMVFEQLCHGCGACFYFCEAGAITEARREIGTVECGRADRVEVVQGRLNLSEVLAPTVIKAVKKEWMQSPRAIIDCPPGMSCPVVEALDGVDYCLVAAEDTPFGLHDMEALIEVLKILKVPFGVVINREGMGDGRVAAYCRKRGIPVLLTIPFDRKIARLVGRGQVFVREMPEWREPLQGLWNKIEEVMSGARTGSAER